MMINTREVLNNAKMAYRTMIDIDGKKLVNNIFDLLEEDKESIIKANQIDINNENGFQIDFNIIKNIKENMNQTIDLYKNIIYMRKDKKNNYIIGEEKDNLGTVCMIYNCNTYCLLETITKTLLTHNSLIVVSEKDYMKGTNELIVILIKRILKNYNIDENLVQIIYTSDFENLLSNNMSINKTIVIGNRELKNKVMKLSKTETVYLGFDSYDIYIEDTNNLDFIKKILEQNNNIEIYAKKGLSLPFEDYYEVQDIDEAIGRINFETAGFSSSIFTDSAENGALFLREIKSRNVSVNASPLINEYPDFNINILLNNKKMFYPSPINNEIKNKLELPI